MSSRVPIKSRFIKIRQRGYGPSDTFPGYLDSSPEPISSFYYRKRAWRSCSPCALQTVKKPSGGVGGAAASPTFIRVSRLCRLRGLLILLAKSIPYKFGRPLVDRICFLEKVAFATFSTRLSAHGEVALHARFLLPPFHRFVVAGGRKVIHHPTYLGYPLADQLYHLFQKVIG